MSMLLEWGASGVADGLNDPSLCFWGDFCYWTAAEKIMNGRAVDTSDLNRHIYKSFAGTIVIIYGFVYFAACLELNFNMYMDQFTKSY